MRRKMKDVFVILVCCWAAALCAAVLGGCAPLDVESESAGGGTPADGGQPPAVVPDAGGPECVHNSDCPDGQICNTVGVCVEETPSCTPSAEVCDGQDNDCDGTVDEDVCGGHGLCEVCQTSDDCGGANDLCLVVNQGQANERRFCGRDCRQTACPAGYTCFAVDGDQQCAPPDLVCGGTSCTPSTEVCDGRDNDCDGQVDEGFEVGNSCTVGVGACQRTGQKVCVADGTSLCSAQVGTPTTEVCGDGIDNDCDGQVDEGCGGCTATTEVCDGRDNDCDGTVDEGLGTLTCGIGACQRTVNNCANGMAQTCTAGQPVSEVCGDGIDNDCDGQVDEGCSTCTPSTEVCDGRDNDCDGQVDEGCGQPPSGCGGDNLLSNPSFESNLDGWFYEVNGNHVAEFLRDCSADVSAPAGSCVVRITNDRAGEYWEVQFKTTLNLEPDPDRWYEARFYVRAGARRNFVFQVLQDTHPFSDGGLWQELAATESWREVRLVFQAKQVSGRHRLTFHVGGGTATVYLDNVRLYRCP